MTARGIIGKWVHERLPDQDGAGDHCELCREDADRLIAALDAAGFAVVPKEPTDKMYFAFYSPDAPSIESVQSLWARRYKAMLTAAKETT